jgi:hypothetical protein
MKRAFAFLAAAGMAVAPVAASAQDASALSVAQGSASTASGASFFSEEGGGGSTAVALGVLLVILIGVAAISGNDGGPNNTPASP